MTKSLAIRGQPLDIMSLGNILAQSGYFSDSQEAAQAIVKVLAGQELGLGPIASMTNIYIIQGKPSLSANGMAAIVKNHPRYDYEVVKLTDELCHIRFLRDGKELGISEFTVKDAQRAGLTTGKNKHSWLNYTRNMLFARAISNGVKWFCPDVTSGVQVYTPDELEAEIDGETGLVIDFASMEEYRKIREYIIENELNGLPVPLRVAKVKQAIEAGELEYSGEITPGLIQELSE
jgi:hypothetical protein